MTHARTIDLREQSLGDAAILFDAACATQAGGFDDAWFEPAFWHAQGRAAQAKGGRGGVTYVHAPQGEWALRHYRRGGWVARLLGDRYLWAGAEATRSFAELRLLAELIRRGLDVPRPVAARYRRRGLHYRADLITGRIADAQTLAQYLARGALDAAIAQRVGAAIARLHAVGAYHADLNAHNILIDPAKVWIIDFDRGELRQPERAWREANLARLRRSLRKLGAGGSGDAEARVFEHDVWQPLRAAYARDFDALVAEATTVASP
jgi:3-deoxy-D-manno-octulosonic acid kinase